MKKPGKWVEVGGKWDRDGNSGPFISLKFDKPPGGTEFLIFPNKYKQAGDKRPDGRIMRFVEDQPEKVVSTVKEAITVKPVEFTPEQDAFFGDLPF